MNRRDFIKTTSVLPAAAAVAVLPQFSLSAFAAAARWRVFEVTTKVEVLKPEGTTRVWLPLPLVADTDYQKNLGSTWSIEGGTAAMTYLFNSLRENHLLSPGDTMARCGQGPGRYRDQPVCDDGPRG